MWAKGVFAIVVKVLSVTGAAAAALYSTRV